MKKKVPTVIKDGLCGCGMGVAIAVPGISAGTIALVLGAYKKITAATSKLFSKDFWRNFLILLPFLIGMVLSVAILYFPFQFAFDYCMLAIVALFAGLILGSIPGILDLFKTEQPSRISYPLCAVGLVVAASIGVLSVVFNLGDVITNLFDEIPFYLYPLIFVVGMVASSGIIIPGFSGSLLLLVLGFYESIFDLLKFNHGIKDLLIGMTFGLGIIFGFILWGKLLDTVINKHRGGTLSVVLGFVTGSLFSIFFNSKMIFYIRNQTGILDWILTPIFVIGGVIVGYLFVRYTRKHPQEKSE